MKMRSALPRSTTLVSPVTSDHAGRAGGGGHGLDDAVQVVQRQALLQDERTGEEAGPRAHDGEVVDGAGDGQRADVAAREEGGRDHVGVGGEGEPGRPDVDQGGVGQGRECRVGERADEHLAGSVRPSADRRRRGRAGRAAGWRPASSGGSATGHVPAAPLVAVVGGAGAFGRHHAGSPGLGRCAATPEQRALGRQTRRPAAPGRSGRRGRPRPSGPRRRSGGRRRGAPARGRWPVRCRG